MKKAEFIEKLGETTELTKKQATLVVDEFWSIIVKAIKKGEEVVFNYGKFVLKKKPATAAREGINPSTGEKIKIAAKPAKVVPQFKPNKKFKEEVVA